MKVIKGKFAKQKLTRGFSLKPEAGESGYSPSEYHVPSSDSQGHTARLAAGVPPPIKRDIQVILSKAGSLTGWETESDFIRWCVVQGLRQVSRELDDPDIRDLRAMNEAWLSANRAARDTLFWRETLNGAVMGIKRFVASKDYIPARRLLHELEKSVLNMASEYWRAKFQKEVIDTYQWIEAKARKQQRQMREDGE